MGPKEALKETVLSAKIEGFQGKCFNCSKKGHRKADCKKPKKKGKKPEKDEKSPSIGPLPTPGDGKGLSPGPEKPTVTANSTREASWMAIADTTYSRDLLWVVDSGSSRYMTYLREVFTKYRVLDTPISVTTANGAHIPAIAEGTILL
jgi:hypothetical protein